MEEIFELFYSRLLSIIINLRYIYRGRPLLCEKLIRGTLRKILHTPSKEEKAKGHAARGLPLPRRGSAQRCRWRAACLPDSSLDRSLSCSDGVTCMAYVTNHKFYWTHHLPI